MTYLFPQDRSITQNENIVELEIIDAQLSGFDKRISTADKLVKQIAFSCLVIFMRMSQQKKLCIKFNSKLFDNNSNEKTQYLTCDFNEEITLEENLQSMACTEIVDAEITKINCDVSIISSNNEEIVSSIGNRIHIGILLSPDDELNNTLRIYFNEGYLTETSAKDLLEKIQSIYSVLQSESSYRLCDLEIVTPTSKAFIPNLHRPIPLEVPILVPYIFRDVAREHWDEIAIIGKDDAYSYGALWLEIKRLTMELQSLHLDKGDIVAIVGSSSFGTIAAMFATLMAGGVLVTLDTALPEERREKISDICNPRFTIQVLPESESRDCFTTNTQLNAIDWPKKGQAPLKSEWAEIDICEGIDQDSAAYIFFTSGSTGEPKGVLGSHIGLAHFLDWQRCRFPIGPGDRNSQLTALSFDVVLRDIFFPLTSGACLCIPERETLFNAREILSWMESMKISVMHCVPSLMKNWLHADEGGRPFRFVRYIFFAGEPLTDTLLNRFRKASSEQAQLVNLYGPTETTLAKLSDTIDPIESGVQSIGRPQPGVDVLIMRDRAVRCGLWEIGEIAIRTPFRSQGYLNQEKLTKQVFLPNPFSDNPADQIYYTGDLGRYRADGKIEIFGRIDSQIKIRGVRIEPNEIESELTQLDAVKAAAISARLNNSGEKFLVAFLILQDSTYLSSNHSNVARTIRDELRSRVHDAMVPSRYIFVQELPYLPNGKLNRKAIGEIRLQTDDEVLERTKIFKKVKSTDLVMISKIESIMGHQIEDLETSFVDQGIDSISFIRASLIIEKELGYLPNSWQELPISQLLKLKRKKAGFLRSIGTPILVRAIAIVLIVMDHLDVLKISGTSTALFLISGWSFGRYQLNTIIKKGSSLPMLRTVLYLLIPLEAFNFFEILKTHYAPSWPVFALINTYGYQYFIWPGYWFLNILIHIDLLLMVLFSSKYIRNNVEKKSFCWGYSAAWIGFGLAVISYFLSEGNSASYPIHKIWLIFLGMAVAFSDTKNKKLLVSILILFTYFDRPTIFPIAAGFFILYFERVKVPGFLSWTLNQIAGASLFIYLSEYQFKGLFQHFFPNLNVIYFILFEIIGGVVIWKLWEPVFNFFESYFDRIKKAFQKRLYTI